MMKKILVILLQVIAFFGCFDFSGGPDDSTYTVIFESNGESETDRVTVNRGSYLMEPNQPVRSGYRFEGWYSDPDFTSAWDFSNDTVEGNMTLYAKWSAIDPASRMRRINSAGVVWQRGQEGVIGSGQVHFVQLTYDFYIDTVPVTQEAYREFMDSNPSYFQGNGSRPVEQVTWFDAVIYCNLLSIHDGLEPCYYHNGEVVDHNTPQGSAPDFEEWVCDFTKNGYRLPTSAEWEYACRGGTTTDYFWGEGTIGDYAWYRDNSNRSTQPVAQKLPNAYGLYDMSGNVWEWCNDWYESYANFENDTLIDPTGPEGSGSGRKVMRGGAWHNEEPYPYLTSAYRAYPEPDHRRTGSNGYGFRVVRSGR